jgi:cyclase
VIGVVDYGAGNLRSVQAALDRLEAPWKAVARLDDLAGVTKVILPGVGRFGPAARRLRETGLAGPLGEFARAGRPFLGICLGMHLLYEGSDEDPGEPGLGLLPGRVRRLSLRPLPHIGWAAVAPLARGEASLLQEVPERVDLYFAHTFAVPPDAAHAAALTLGPAPFAAAVARGAVWGVQFHPEKSAEWGLRILARFAATGPACGGSPAESRDAAAIAARAAAAFTARDAATVPAEGGRLRRVIPCLDIQGGRVVKGIGFQDLRDAGDPVERARAYDRDGADEVCLLDMSASREERRPLLDLVGRVGAQLTVPLMVGGGIRTVEEMRALLLAGADRVSIGTAACEDPELIARAAAAFGSQFVVVSIDARRLGEGYEVTTHGGRRGTGWNAVLWARGAERLGAGEILLNAMDADGTRGGYDTTLTARVARAVNIPVIASGGAGAPADMARVFREGEADAALAASIFHDGSVSIRQAKKALALAGVRVRL